jgi:site-specific DNA recombinase
LFEKVQNILAGRKNAMTNYRHENPDFPLRRFVSNEEGINLTGYWSKGRHIKYPYYTFSQAGTTIRKEVLEQRFADYLALFEFDSAHLHSLRTGLLKAFKKQVGNKENDFEQIRNSISECNKKIDHYVTLQSNGDISKATMKDRITVLEGEIETLKDILAIRPKQNYNIKNLITFAEKVLKDPYKLWESSPFEKKKLLQRFYFPLGIVYNGHYFRTTKMCMLFKLKTTFEGYIFPRADLKDQKTNTALRRSFLEDQKLLETEGFWTGIMEELVELDKILSE